MIGVWWLSNPLPKAGSLRPAGCSGPSPFGCWTSPRMDTRMDTQPCWATCANFWPLSLWKSVSLYVNETSCVLVYAYRLPVLSLGTTKKSLASSTFLPLSKYLYILPTSLLYTAVPFQELPSSSSSCFGGIVFTEVKYSWFWYLCDSSGFQITTLSVIGVR